MKKQAKSFLIICLIVLAVAFFIVSIQNKNLKDNKSNLELSRGIGTEAVNGTPIINATENITPEVFLPDYECMNDSQCNEADICVNHTCSRLICDFPYYADNHKCERLQCINNEECKENQFCWNVTNVCVKPACDYCEYAGNHTCIKYECCADKECPGEQSVCFYRKCLVSPSQIPFDMVLTGNRRTSYRVILNYSVLRNFDVGLLLAQNQTELDYINNKVLYLWDNTTFNFTDYVLLIVMHHGIMPSDIRIRKILQLGNAVYVDIITDQGETGFTDDAWEVVAIRKENFTSLSDLSFSITPTGKMIVGGEQMLSGINIDSPPAPPVDMCVNATVYEGETKTIDLLGKNYSIHLLSVEKTSGINYVSFSVDEGVIYRLGESNDIKIGDIRVYTPIIGYPRHDEDWGYTEFSICYKSS